MQGTSRHADMVAGQGGVSTPGWNKARLIAWHGGAGKSRSCECIRAQRSPRPKAWQAALGQPGQRKNRQATVEAVANLSEHMAGAPARDDESGPTREGTHWM